MPSVEETTQMTSDQVETLVKKAISFSDDNPVLTKRIKRQRIVLFCICLLVTFMENLFIYTKGVMSEILIVIDLMEFHLGHIS